MDEIAKREKEAADKVAALLALPMPEREEIGAEGLFDPWEIFPAMYGTYGKDFDDCAIEVLGELLDMHRQRRQDLGANMLREMLCTSDLCNYGTSPRVCFPTQDFGRLLPELIEKWKAYSALEWA